MSNYTNSNLSTVPASSHRFPFDDYTEPWNPTADYVYGVLCFVCVAVGVPGNIFTFLKLLTGQKDPACILHLGVTLVDILICLTPIPMGVSYFQNRTRGLFKDETFMYIWGVTSHVCYYLSLLYGTILTLIRSSQLLRPHSKISKSKGLVVSIMVGCLVLVGVAATYIILGVGEGYVGYVRNGTVFNGGWSFKITTIVFSCFLYPLILAGFVVAIYTLVKTSRMSASDVGGERRYAAVTIAIFTVLYVVLKVPRILLDIPLSGIPIIRYVTLFASNYVYNVLNFLFIPLNSACNSILYITRMKGMAGVQSRMTGMSGVQSRGSMRELNSAEEVFMRY